MQLAQYYIGALVAGGVLCACSLLLGGFGKRAEAAFTPVGWVAAFAGGLVIGGAAGLARIALGAEGSQQDTLWVAVGAGAPAALVGFGLQRWARASSRARDGGMEDGVQGAAPETDPSGEVGEVAPGPDSP